MSKVISIGTKLTIEDAIKFTKTNFHIELTEKQKSIVQKCREKLDMINQKEEPVYGVSTGFGHLQNTWIEPSKQKDLQINLIRSHAIATGDIVPKKITRTAMVLLSNSLAKGHSGIRLETLELLIQLINKSIIPVTYNVGSLGASGDLAPLAHIALVLIGEGKVRYNEKIWETKNLFEKLSIDPINLEAKEGLALINGTHFITSYALHILERSRSLLIHSFISSSITIEALRGTDKQFSQRISDLRPHPGHVIVSKIMRKLLQGSKIIKSHEDPSSDHKIQDPYALRCIPQVLGGIWDSLAYLERVVEIEINSVTDNPLIFWEDEEIISGGNFHGEPLGFPLETVNMALVELANITEARISKLVSPFTSELPAFLANTPGIESGYMIAHYTAAAILNELRSSSHPNITDNIPVSGGQEDHVSMVMGTATKVWKSLNQVTEIIGIELLMGVRGLNMVEHPSSSVIIEKQLDFINNHITYEPKDHVVKEKLDEITNLIQSKRLIIECEKDLSFIPNTFNFMLK